KVLFVGDIVGSAGRKALKDNLPSLRSEHNPNFIVINGENAAGGKGITKAIANEFFDLGAHGISMGNHTWDNKDIFEWIDQEPRLIRPANYPKGPPGSGFVTLKSNQKELMIVNIMGRAFLPPLECPFRTMDEVLAPSKKHPKAVLV